MKDGIHYIFENLIRRVEFMLQFPQDEVEATSRTGRDLLL